MKIGLRIATSIATLVLATSLAGCLSPPKVQTHVKVLINSDPQYASIYEANKMIGTTPYRGAYKLDDENRAKGHIKIAPLTIRWASGTSRIANFTLPIDGTYREITIPRPNAPNVEIDLEYALRKEQLEIERSRAGAERDAANAAASQAEAARRNADVNENKNFWNNYWNMQGVLYQTAPLLKK